MEEIAQKLEQFGLDEKETKVYLALLSLGQASVSAIAKHAGIERTGTYDVLDRLVAQGLTKPVQTGKVIGFTAHDPRQFLSKIDSQKQQFVALLPQLEQLYTQSQTKPIEQFFEGEKFAELWQELTALRGKDIHMIATSIEDMSDEIEKLLKQWPRQGNEVRVLASNTIELPQYIGIARRRITRGEDLPLSVICFDATTIYIGAADRLYAWQIRSATVAKLHSSLFNEIWERSIPR